MFEVIEQLSNAAAEFERLQSLLTALSDGMS